MTKAKQPPASVKWYRFLLRGADKVIKIILLFKRMLQVRIFLKQFDFREDDIYVVTYIKSGTTLLQMMLYQLLTDGNMDFEHIYDVSPFLEQSIDQGKRLDQLPSPRVLKTHAEYKSFPRKVRGRIIYCIRDGMDVAVSLFHQCKDLEFSRMGWDEYLKKVFARESWFKHVRDWLKNANHYNVYYIYYEDLTQNPSKAIEGLAAFLGLTVTEETLQRTVQRCSFQFMKENQEKFGARRMKDKRRLDQFIRKGESFKGQLEFSEEQKRWYHDEYAKNLSKFKLKYDSSIAGNRIP